MLTLEGAPEGLNGDHVRAATTSASLGAGSGPGNAFGPFWVVGAPLSEPILGRRLCIPCAASWERRGVCANWGWNLTNI